MTVSVAAKPPRQSSQEHDVNLTCQINIYMQNSNACYLKYNTLPPNC